MPLCCNVSDAKTCLSVAAPLGVAGATYNKTQSVSGGSLEGIKIQDMEVSLSAPKRTQIGPQNQRASSASLFTGNLAASIFVHCPV